MQARNGLTIDVAARTHVGHVRQRNEDCAVVGDSVVQADEDAIERGGAAPHCSWPHSTASAVIPAVLRPSS